MLNLPAPSSPHPVLSPPPQRAHGRPLLASPERDAPHRVGPAPPSAHKSLPPAALWRQSPSSGGLTNPKTGKRLGFAVVELFAVSSESLKLLEKSAGEAHSRALAQVAKLQSQLAAAEALRQDAERDAALEWRRMRQEVGGRGEGYRWVVWLEVVCRSLNDTQTDSSHLTPDPTTQAARLTEQLRGAEDATRAARSAADDAGMQVLQLEQRVGQLSADKQAAAQVGGQGRVRLYTAAQLRAQSARTSPHPTPTLSLSLSLLSNIRAFRPRRIMSPAPPPQSLLAAEGRAQVFSQRLAAMEAAYETERRSWAEDAEGWVAGAGGWVSVGAAGLGSGWTEQRSASVVVATY
jgi:hypothetical protein